jgi:phytoene dehydrogenase-like protein
MDAIVIGAGPNGLVAANLLADAGWSVLVLEEQPTPGGAVRSAEVTAPGFGTDLFSAFYPLALASPPMLALDLERYGLRWRHAPLVLADPAIDGTCAVLSRDLVETAAGLDADAPGDGAAWRELADLWGRVRGPLLDALFAPFPPVVPAARLVARLGGPAAAARFARTALLPVRRLGAERFRGTAGPLLLAGNTLHTDLGPDSAGGALFGLILAMLGQEVGFPAPAGGAGELTAALVRRLEARGGRVRCATLVRRVVIRDGRAVGVRTADGEVIAAGRAVLAAVDAPQLYQELVGTRLLPAATRADLDRFQWDHATVKVDWALAKPIPWTAPPARRAGTVHVTGGMDALTTYSAQLASGFVPAAPMLVMGQMTTTDPTRSPAGTESAWAYTHVPQRVRGDAGGAGLTGRWDAAETDRFVERVEARLERYAPGFRDLILARHVQTPATFTAADRSLRGGAQAGGTAALHQQLVFRPTIGLAGARTPVRGLYLASASAHPGGGVHGGPGATAARAAVRHSRRHHR